MYIIIILIFIIVIIILYKAYDYYKKQTREMFKALCSFRSSYCDKDDVKFAKPMINYIDENGFKKKIIYDKSKLL